MRKRGLNRTVLFLIAAFAAFALCTLLLSRHTDYILSLCQTDPRPVLSRVMTILKILAGFVVLSVLVISVFFLSVAVRTIRYEQYPPPGMKLRRERVRSIGREARCIGVMFIISSLVLIAFSGYLFAFVVEGGCGY